MAEAKQLPRYQVVDGIICPQFFPPSCLREALQYKHQDDDVFIVTYPKCGTTWMQNIVLQIYRSGKPLQNTNEFFVGSPFIDFLGNQGVNMMPRPGAIKTHLPYTRLQHSPKAKYIFVVRNPKDACVSLYHHIRMIPGYKFWDGDFGDFFELFLDGKVEYGDFFDHLLSWHPHRDSLNFFYTTYEKMKRDTKDVIVKLCHFLGPEYGRQIESDNNMLNNILANTDFKHMKNLLGDAFDPRRMGENIQQNPNTPNGLKYVANYMASMDIPFDRIDKMEFVRKGVVGDWKSLFTPAQAQRMDKRFEHVAKTSDIDLLWK